MAHVGFQGTVSAPKVFISVLRLIALGLKASLKTEIEARIVQVP